MSLKSVAEHGRKPTDAEVIALLATTFGAKARQAQATMSDVAAFVERLSERSTDRSNAAALAVSAGCLAVSVPGTFR